MYTNPRLFAEFENWPSGGKTVKCEFIVEDGGKKGYRIKKRTYNPRLEDWNKPKLSTYSGKTVIVDKDNKTYILQHAYQYGFISVMTHDFMQHETVHESSSPEKFRQLMSLINEKY